jgi:hypothetical protein
MRGDETVVIGNYMTVAEIAALKQEMIGGGWPVSGSCAIRVNSETTDDRILLDLSDAGSKLLGHAELYPVDHRARTATVSWWSVAELPSRPPDSILDFAHSEFGLATLDALDS